MWWISVFVTSAIVERDAVPRGAGSGTVSVSIPGLSDGSMVAGKGDKRGASALLQNERLKFIVCFLGVFVCYFYYGILQETM